MQSKVIVPTRIEVEQRSGTDILVVEDGNKEQYTTPDPYLVNWANKHEEKLQEKYIGQKWKIAFTRTEKGYRDFDGFLSKAISKEDQKQELGERVDSLESELENMKEVVMEMSPDE